MAKTVTIEAMIMTRTPKALLLNTTGDEDDAGTWVPVSKVSRCDILHPDEEIYEIDIPEWIAIKEGLI